MTRAGNKGSKDHKLGEEFQKETCDIGKIKTDGKGERPSSAQETTKRSGRKKQRPARPDFKL